MQQNNYIATELDAYSIIISLVIIHLRICHLRTRDTIIETLKRYISFGVPSLMSSIVRMYTVQLVLNASKSAVL